MITSGEDGSKVGDGAVKGDGGIASFRRAGTIGQATTTKTSLQTGLGREGGKQSGRFGFGVVLEVRMFEHLFGRRSMGRVEGEERSEEGGAGGGQKGESGADDGTDAGSFQNIFQKKRRSLVSDTSGRHRRSIPVEKR